MITCIVKLRDRPVVDQLPEDEPLSPQYTMAEAAQEVKGAFGRGGNPDAPIPEEFVGWVNTPPTPDGYFRCAFDAAYSQAMEYVQSIGGTVTCDIIAVEWEGQEMFQVGISPASSGSMTIEHDAEYEYDQNTGDPGELLVEAWTETMTWDIPEHPEYLAFISGCPMKQTEAVEE